MSATESQFVFRAMTSSGGRKLGMRQSADERSLAEELRADKLLLIKAWKLPSWAASEQKLPLKDEALLNEQLAILLSRGVPLVEALEVASSVVSKKSKAKVAKLRELVAAGDSFARACDKVGGFDLVTIAVYSSAERTGDLASAADRLMDAARRRLTLMSKAITLMIYPSVIAFFSFVVITALLGFIVPMIGKTLRDNNPNMNAFSDAVISFGSWLNANFSWFILGVFLLICTLVAFRTTIAAVAAKIVQRLPLASKLMLTVEMARFFAIMGAMTRSGVPLADALGTATKLITNDTLRGQLEWLRQSLVDGGVLRNLIERVDALPFATRKLLIAAERSGDLDQAFETLSSDMADAVDTQSERFVAMLEPAVILLMFVLVGPILLAVAIPMLTLQIEG
ncbi:MAG: type II secretion system F family protein [Phycisphaerales bacterium]